MQAILTPLLAVMAAILLCQCNKTTETALTSFKQANCIKQKAHHISVGFLFKLILWGEMVNAVTKIVTGLPVKPPYYVY